MKVTSLSNDTFLIKLERGEPVLARLTSWCETENIGFATCTGIGAVEQVTCGYYDLPSKEYRFTDYSALVEVVSMTGNVSHKEGKPYFHVHALFTDQENHVFGGHVVEMQVGVTLEVVLKKYEVTVERKFDAEIGLFLLDCDT